jgi:hypothetical protein
MLVTACARVPVYQRGKLAHPTMAPDGLDGPTASHVHTVHEGAIGGGFEVGGGCGCN